MGSGVSVPANDEKVAQMLSVLSKDELAGLKLSSSTLKNENMDDKVPRQIKEKVARLVVSAMTNSPDRSQINMNSDILEHLSELPQILSDIEQTSNLDARRRATEQIRRFLSVEKEPPIQVVIDAGCVPLLVSFLDHHNDPTLQLEAGWALTNIASGTTTQTDAVIQAGAVTAFVKLLRLSTSVQIREQSIWALGNIAGDSAARRDLVLQSDVLTPLLKEITDHTSAYSKKKSNSCFSQEDNCKEDDFDFQLSKDRENFHDLMAGNVTDRSEGILRNAAWLLSNLCRGRPRVSLDKLRMALPALAALIEFVKDEEALSDALWAASYLSDGDQDNIDAVLNADCFSPHSLASVKYHQYHSIGSGDFSSGDYSEKDGTTPLDAPGGSLSVRIVELLTHQKESIVTPALRCIGNLVTGDDASTDIAMKISGCLQSLKRIVLTPTKKAKKTSMKSGSVSSDFIVSASIKKEACWTLSNMLAGTKSQIQMVFDIGILTPLISIATLKGKALKMARRQSRTKGKKMSFKVAPYSGKASQEGGDEGSGGGGGDDDDYEDEEALMREEEQRLQLELEGKTVITESDIHKEAVWAVANAASGASKKQIRFLIKAGSIPALVSSLYSEDPAVGAVAGDGLTHLLRKAGGSNKKGYYFARGTPAFKWRNRVVREIKRSGGISALKSLASRVNNQSAQQRGMAAMMNMNNRFTSSGYLIEAEREASSKATALLSLITFTRALLKKARREYSKGKKGVSMEEIGQSQLFEEDVDDEGEVDEDEGEDNEEDNDDEEDDDNGSYDEDGSTRRNQQDDYDDFMGGGEEDNSFGEFEGEADAKPTGGRVITVGQKMTQDDADDSFDNVPGKVQVRRLGGNQSSGGGRRRNSQDDDDDDDDMERAMEMLQRDMTMVNLVNDSSKPKRGWTSAWNV